MRATASSHPGPRPEANRYFEGGPSRLFPGRKGDLWRRHLRRARDSQASANHRGSRIVELRPGDHQSSWKDHLGDRSRPSTRSRVLSARSIEPYSRGGPGRIHGRVSGRCRQTIDEAPEEHKGALHEDYLEGIGKLEDRLVIILNVRNLLSGDPEDLLEAVGMTVAGGAK